MDKRKANMRQNFNKKKKSGFPPCRERDAEILLSITRQVFG